MARNMASQDDQLALIAAAFDEAAKGKKSSRIFS